MQVQDTTLQEALWSEDCVEQIKAIQLAARQRREDLLPDLIRLLSADHVGYFVEEVLPSFGEVVRPPLSELLRNPSTDELARYRAAGTLARFGDVEAVPILLQAIGRTHTNQTYFSVLTRLAPEALKKRLVRLIQEKAFAMFMTTEPDKADYLSKLILTLYDVHGQGEITPLLEGLRVGAKDWRVRAAAEVALAPR
jgi:HEAT repeat protein